MVAGNRAHPNVDGPKRLLALAMGGRLARDALGKLHADLVVPQSPAEGVVTNAVVAMCPSGLEALEQVRSQPLKAMTELAEICRARKKESHATSWAASRPRRALKHAPRGS